MRVDELQEMLGLSGLNQDIVAQCDDLERRIAEWEPRPQPRNRRRDQAPQVQIRAAHRPILVQGEVW